MVNNVTSLAAAQLANCAGVLADPDGCLWSDGALLPGAQHLARRFPGRLAIVSNNFTPAPALFAAALRRLGIEAREAVMIGDNPVTDIAGAAAGIAGVLVGRHPDAAAGSLQHLLGRAAPGNLCSTFA